MHQKPKKIQRGLEGAYRFADFELDPSERLLRCKGEAVALQPKTFDALLLLVRNSERLVRKQELMDAVWPDTHVSEANLTNTIVALRKILGHDAIQTVSKHGYRFLLRIEGEPGVQQAAFATFVRAKELTRERSLETMMRARDLYWLCLAQDPGFAQAWAWLGRCCRFLDKFGIESSVNMELAQAAFHRAFAIDPDLASAHHFYTQLEADLGQAQQAMVRLLKRAAKHSDEAESFAGLVQVLRSCGLLDESLASHQRAVTLDPTIVTSVAHTHFLRCEYEATIETYSGRTGYYLDAAAWAALGDTRRAISLLRNRLAGSRLSPLMSGLMNSLFALLEGRDTDAVESMRTTEVAREPEVLFYFARHFARLGLVDAALTLVRRAESEGYTCSNALAHDSWFSSVRAHPEFEKLIRDLKACERKARRALEEVNGSAVLTGRAARQ